MVSFAIAIDGKPAEVQDLAIVVQDGPAIRHLREMPLLKRRVSDEVANDSGIGEHPIAASGTEPARGNTTYHPTSRLSVSRCTEKKIPRRQRHGSPGRRFQNDRRGLVGQLK
jgi:hypothetical protein